jgi:glycosyltransferase involved in cell wall biosynthesis
MISILMPVKNAAPFLKECLNSILNQAIRDWELLAVDDGSSDASGSILEAFARQDKRIKKFINHGQGIIPALNTAFKESKGQFITRMDADDKMPSQKLLRLKQELELHGPRNLTTGKVQYFSEHHLGDGYRQYQNWLNGLIDSDNHFQHIYKECVIPSPCWMVYREDLESCGAFTLNSYPEDYDLCFRFYQAGLKVKGIDQILHLWRDHPERTSRTDPNYSDVHFFELKMDYFLKLEYQSYRPLVLWGTGRKGKKLAKILQRKNIPFHWITNNSKKIGHVIYNSLVESSADLSKLIRPQIILAIAAPEAIEQIQFSLHHQNLELGEDYFFFC